MNNNEPIEELYYSIYEKYNNKIANTQEYKDIMEKSDELLKELKCTISDKEYDTLGEFIDKYTELISLGQKEYFVKGFSMANKLVIDSLDK